MINLVFCLSLFSGHRKYISCAAWMTEIMDKWCDCKKTTMKLIAVTWCRIADMNNLNSYWNAFSMAISVLWLTVLSAVFASNKKEVKNDKIIVIKRWTMVLECEIVTSSPPSTNIYSSCQYLKVNILWHWHWTVCLE